MATVTPSARARSPDGQLERKMELEAIRKQHLTSSWHEQNAPEKMDTDRIQDPLLDGSSPLDGVKGTIHEKNSSPEFKYSRKILEKRAKEAGASSMTPMDAFIQEQKANKDESRRQSDDAINALHKFRADGNDVISRSTKWKEKKTRGETGAADPLEFQDDPTLSPGSVGKLAASLSTELGDDPKFLADLPSDEITFVGTSGQISLDSDEEKDEHDAGTKVTYSQMSLDGVAFTDTTGPVAFKKPEEKTKENNKRLEPAPEDNHLSDFDTQGNWLVVDEESKGKKKSNRNPLASLGRLSLGKKNGTKKSRKAGEEEQRQSIVRSKITEQVVTQALADRDQGSLSYSSIFVRASYDPKYPPHVRKLKTDEEYEPPKKRKNLRRCLVTASVPVFAHYALMSDVKSIRNEIVESLRQAVASGIFTHEGIDLEN
eukprot:scaffold225471_cov48-Attheya_sp.AAC.2